VTQLRFCAVFLALLAAGAPGSAQQNQPIEAQPPAPAPAPAAQEAPSEAPAAEAASRRPESISIYALLARVAESTGKQFLVDPRVRAEVVNVPTLETPTYAQLLSILSIHGYIAVETGGNVQVVPDRDARQLATPLVQQDDPSVPDDEVVTRVITLSDRAPQLVPILRPMMPQWAHLAAMTPNKLVITDRYANVRRITQVARILSEGTAADRSDARR
jgi:general secretion pathway protein D